MTQNHKAIEQPERYRRLHEEVDCRDAIDMIGQEDPPTLRRRPTPVDITCDWSVNRDGIYGADVTRRLRAMGIRDKPIAPSSPSICLPADVRQAH